MERQDFLTSIKNDEISQTDLSISHDVNNPRTAIIRTSDRIAFKNCRRRWGWSSHLRHNLGSKDAQSALWFGSGFHFALEDFHGWNKFNHPRKAFEAYYKCFKEFFPTRLPDDHAELLELGKGMLDYYIIWLQQRKNSLMKTYWHNGEPQVEVNARFPIPWEKGKYGYDEVWYSLTIDRVAIDEDGMLWFCDYKTAKAIQVLHYLVDPQVNAYMWGGSNIYELPIKGFIYQQHKKSIPNPGRLVYGGTRVSTAQNQNTTHFFYRQTLIDVYGSVEKAPPDNISFLNGLLRTESELHDSFIRIDKIYKNKQTAESVGAKVLMEVEDMLNPELPLYPNESRECALMPCPFLSACISMDDGSDWQHELQMTTRKRDDSYDIWRNKIEWPGEERITKTDRGYLDV